MRYAIALFVLSLAGAGLAQPDSKAAILAAHNRERAAMKQPPLVWDDALAGKAAIWATKLAATGQFDHDSQKGDGENLWMGTRGAYTPTEMVDGWIDEKKDFMPGIFPKISRTGNWSDVGHYTQLIWARTTRVGCAIRSNASDDYLVCRYGPPGNWIGENPLGDSHPAAPARKRLKRRTEN